MITYFCHFGDQEVGEKFRKVIFGKIKLISLFESKFQETNFPTIEHKLLIRFHIDGKITQFENCIDKKIIVDKKNKVLVFSRKLSSENANSMSLEETYKYIYESTIDSIKLFNNELINKKSKIHLDNASLFLLIDEVFNEIKEFNL